MRAEGPQLGPVLRETAQIWPEEREERQKDTFYSKTYESGCHYISANDSHLTESETSVAKWLR